MSGRKNVLAPYHAISSGDMSANITQAVPTNIQYLDNVAVQLNFTGTPTGTFQIQVSLDKVNWIPLSLSPTPGATGSSGNILLDLNGISMPWIRVFYSASSGTGTLDAWISGKMV